MYVVIFHATIKSFDADYAEMASRLRDLALQEFGCLAFHPFTEGNRELALSYWPDLDSIRRWRAHPLHMKAQQLGRERWYADHRVEVAELQRSYGSLPGPSGPAS